MAEANFQLAIYHSSDSDVDGVAQVAPNRYEGQKRSSDTQALQQQNPAQLVPSASVQQQSVDATTVERVVEEPSTVRIRGRPRKTNFAIAKNVEQSQAKETSRRKRRPPKSTVLNQEQNDDEPERLLKVKCNRARF